MKITFSLIILAGVTFLVSQVHAASMTLPAIAGTPDPDYTTDCSYSSNGTVTGGSSSGGCALNFQIPIAAGATLNSVTVYYFDNSGTQFMVANLIRETLSSTSSSALDSDSDSSISASGQALTLSYGSATSSSYAYRFVIWFGNGTEVGGVSISY